MNDAHKKRYRVAQWGTGNIGLRSLRTVIEHPQYDLVAVYVYSDAKAGQDAGDLCALGKTGVVATKNVDDIVAAAPDCVLYMPGQVEYDMVCRLLEAGINVVSTRGEFHYPDGLEPSVRQRVEDACRKGGSSIFSTGSSPGFATEVIPFALALMQRRLDCLTLEEFADMSSRNSPEMIFDGLGFGRAPVQLDEATQSAMAGNAPSLRMAAAALSLPLDEVTGTVEYAVARHRLEIAAGTIEAGTVAAIRMVTNGMRNGKTVFRKRGLLYLTRDIEPAWELRDTGWRFLVEGDAPLEVSISFPVSDADYAAFSPGLTAHPPVNAIPYICDAAPGLRTTADLPMLLANLSS